MIWGEVYNIVNRWKMKRNNQENLFRLTDSTGILKPAKSQTVIDPFISHLNRINDVKRIHYDSFKLSEKGKKHIDLVFQALQCFNNLTDREIQAMTGLEISSIPARRADISNDNKKYKGWVVEVKEHRKCNITNTKKCAWELKRID